MLEVRTTGPFRRVITATPHETCIQHLLALGTPRRVEKLIQRNTGTCSLNDVELQRVVIWLQQGIEYFEIAKRSSRLSKYIIGYYGILNLSNVVISVLTGALPSSSSHGLSRDGQSKHSLHSYRSKIQKSGSFIDLGLALGLNTNDIPNSSKLTEILLSDLATSSLVSDTLALPPLCVRGSIDCDKYEQFLDQHRTMVKTHRFHPPHQYINDAEKSSVVTGPFSIDLDPSSKLEFDFIIKEWSQFISPTPTADPQAFPHRVGLKLYVEDIAAIKMGYELDGLGQPTISSFMPGGSTTWPCFLRYFSGLWVLADIARYTSELLVGKIDDESRELQIACELFTDAAISGAPLKCLQSITKEFVWFAPQWFL